MQMLEKLAIAVISSRKLSAYLRTPLKSTGMPPHFSVAVDKSTPHRDTNQAIMIILPFKGKRHSMPIDAPVVYEYSVDDGAMQGGSGKDLANQIYEVLVNALGLQEKDFHFLRGVHADGQYQARTFQQQFLSLVGCNQEIDNFFFLPWDVSHWMDLVLVDVRENSDSSEFLKTLIKRSNRFHKMYARGLGHVEYIGLAKSLGLKSLETVTYATTRFSSSAYEQWDKIYRSYPALTKAFIAMRENSEDDCEEVKYQIRGQDYAIDLCGTLDIMKPAVTLMIKSQGLNVPPWKIVTWFPKMIAVLDDMKNELDKLKNGNTVKPNRQILPTLAMHWEDLTHDNINDCHFQGIEVLEGWLVVEQHNNPDQMDRCRQRRRQTLFEWEARSPKDCLGDLILLCQELKTRLQRKFRAVLPENVKKLASCFDLPSQVKALCSFSYHDGKLVIDQDERVSWGTSGESDFAEYFKYVCQVPHVKNVSSEEMLMFTENSHQIVYRNFKTTLMRIVWQNLGNSFRKIFTGNKLKIPEFSEKQLVSLEIQQFHTLDEWFLLKFSDGTELTARLDEEFIISLFYENEEVIKSMGREMSVCLDIALAGSGCEAVVEGFYSLVGQHKKAGGQSNQVLMQRSIVDWCIPHPIRSPEAMEAIAKLYTDGDEESGLRRHRLPVRIDERIRAERAFKRFKTSKVVDRMSSEATRCPHIVMDFSE